MELYELTVHELSERLAKKEVSAAEALESVLSRIAAVEPRVGAYLRVTEDQARAEARAADQAISRGETKPLLGVPIAVKDLFLTQGVPTTAGSKILEHFIPPYDATAVARLKAAGAVLVGKLNLDEFAMGNSTEHSAYQLTHNPWDLERVPGGSSGGSAAAIAADECIGALGTDTGGSIRQPAAACGVVGIKPTYGRVSRYGVIAFASSLDQVGAIAKDVKDAAIMLNVLAGHDPLDSTSAPVPVPDYTEALGKDIKGMKIALPRQYFTAGLDPEVEAALRGAVKTLSDLGAEVGEVDMPHAGHCVACYYIIAPAEASSNLARYDGVRFGLRDREAQSLIEMFKRTRNAGFGPEVKRRILIGTYTLSAGYYDAYYLKACRVRTLIKQDFDRAFENFDLLAAPVMPSPPIKIGEKTDDPLAMYLLDILTLSLNLAGLPGMSVPCGFTGSGLPVGMQLLAKPFNEPAIFRAAHAFEQATEWHKRKPAL